MSFQVFQQSIFFEEFFDITKIITKIYINIFKIFKILVSKIG